MSGLWGSGRFLLNAVVVAAAVFAVAPVHAEDSPPNRRPLAAGHSWLSQKLNSCSVDCPDRSFDRSVSYPERLTEGYTLVLPGVLGTTPYNTKLIRLLKDAPTAVDYFDWTRGVPLFQRRGLRREDPNSVAAGAILQRIVDYQDRFPGRPVHVVALCAGAGPACEALARLAPERSVNSAILLGPALSPGYDLRPALRGTQNGIDSFHSPLDVPVLVALTTVVGTVDGQHLPAAGAIGFVGARHDSPQLRQHMYNPKMLMQGHYGGHFGWTASRFVAQNVIPIIASHETVRASSE
ncbi:MAG: hypothetical protein RIK87_16595 [Fuerstiella sp.]